VDLGSWGEGVDRNGVSGFGKVCHLFIFTVCIIGADCSLFTLLFSSSLSLLVQCLDSGNKVFSRLQTES